MTILHALLVLLLHLPPPVPCPWADRVPVTECLLLSASDRCPRDRPCRSGPTCVRWADSICRARGERRPGACVKDSDCDITSEYCDNKNCRKIGR